VQHALLLPHTNYEVELFLTSFFNGPCARACASSGLPFLPVVLVSSLLFILSPCSRAYATTPGARSLPPFFQAVPRPPQVGLPRVPLHRGLPCHPRRPVHARRRVRPQEDQHDVLASVSRGAVSLSSNKRRICVSRPVFLRDRFPPVTIFTFTPRLA